MLNQAKELLDFSSVWLWIALIGVIFMVKWRRRHENIPPGPYGLPFVGYEPFLTKKPFSKFLELGKVYGDVMSLNISGNGFMVLNSYRAIKECFVRKGEHFTGRASKNSFSSWIVDGLGISQDEGSTWREHRRFALHTLRDFGFGKLSLEQRVQEIGLDLVTTLVSTMGLPYDAFNVLSNSAFNVILYLTADKHFEPYNADFRFIQKSVRINLTKMLGLSAFIETPLMKILPMRFIPGMGRIVSTKLEVQKLLEKYILEHEATFDQNNLRDYIDVFLSEMKTAQSDNKQTSFDIERLVGIFLNMLFAGTETTSNTLYWSFRLLMHRPEVQEKVHRELDEVVGRERLPSILDRPKLPYTEAVILEVQRFSTIAPFGVPHTNPVATTLYGYHIPARTIVLPNLWAVHNDPQMFPQPENFDPERFMDPDLKNIRRERVIPFSIGKRSCLGKSLAQMELFIFFTMIMQRFHISPPDGSTSTDPIRTINSFLSILDTFQVCVTSRY